MVYLTQVENHRMVEVEMGLRTPSPLLKQGHLEPVDQDHVQTAFEYLQEWRFTQPLWSTCENVLHFL